MSDGSTYASVLPKRGIGVVYFVRRSCGAIKIGLSWDLERRLIALRSQWGKLELLATMPGDRATERALHRRFAEEALGREWFIPSPRLYATIEAHKTL